MGMHLFQLEVFQMLSLSRQVYFKITISIYVILYRINRYIEFLFLFYNFHVLLDPPLLFSNIGASHLQLN